VYIVYDDFHLIFSSLLQKKIDEFLESVKAFVLVENRIDWQVNTTVMYDFQLL
jgi:hypothetical protein